MRRWALPQLPGMANAPSDAIQRLIDVVAQLRDPTTGCPWDLEQTHASLVPYVLEAVSYTHLTLPTKA